MLNFGKLQAAGRPKQVKNSQAPQKKAQPKDPYAETRKRLEKMRAIVSMTSYPKRIHNVGKAIKALLEKQTRKPDEVHLWLCQLEFPEKEKSLPSDLVSLAEREDKVKIHWTNENTFVHKRHEVFKLCKKNDLVFLMDDDVYYKSVLIDTVMRTAAANPGTIVLYNMYSLHLYKGRRILYRRPDTLNAPGQLVNRIRWCGQSAIPADTYPMEALSPENKKIRNATSPVSDGCWMHPWLVYNDVPIYCLNFGWGEDIDKKDGKDSGLVSWTHNKDENGYEKRDNWLFAVVSSYPKIWQKYIKLFNYEKPN